VVPDVNRITSRFILLLILSSLIVSFSEIGTVRAQETVYIRADGTVEGTDKIQREGDVYTLTGNINGSIVMERNNTVIYGAGYTLQGSGNGIGIYVCYKSNVTIKNINVRTFKIGIYYYHSNGSTISGNVVTNNHKIGIYIHRSYNNSISGNSLERNSGSGIQLAESYYNIVFENNITANGVGVDFGSGGGYNTLFQNIIANNGYGFTFWVSSRNTIYGNDIFNNTNQVHTWSSSNDWDYNSRGNHWSDYSSKYPNATEIDNSGIGDTPYRINTSPEDYGDADNYPLMEPIIIPEFPSWTQMLISVVILAGAVAIYKLRLHKKPMHIQ